MTRALPPPETAALCVACFTYHEDPPCAHDPQTPCAYLCGLPRGYRWMGRDGKPGGDPARRWRCDPGWRVAS